MRCDGLGRILSVCIGAFHTDCYYGSDVYQLSILKIPKAAPDFSKPGAAFGDMHLGQIYLCGLKIRRFFRKMTIMAEARQIINTRSAFL